MQVLATQRPFCLDMPVINLELLAPGKTSSLLESPPINLSNLKGISLTAQCTYHKKASNPLRIHVISSPDGVEYDTSDLFTLDNDFQKDNTVIKTFEFDTNVKFIKIVVENLDESQSISNIKIVVTLKG